MADSMLKCPLCCNKTFDSKIALIVHLKNLLTNLCCPICDSKWSSLTHLIEHLRLDECQPEYIVETLEEDNDSVDDSIIQADQCNDEKLKTDEYETQISSDSDHIVKEFTETTLNDGKMYMTLLDEKTKTCIQTQELKLVSQDGQMEQFVFMAQEAPELGLDNTVVTKQGNEWTRLVAIKDIKTKSETVIAPSESEVADTEELYSCNTCGVSFTSLIDHIQNYHNDQEVVVEEPVDEDDNGLMEPIQYNTLPSEGVVEKQEAPRRVITDTGDIVEEDVLMNSNIQSNEFTISNQWKDMPKAEKQNRTQSKRFVQIDEFCDSMVKNIKVDVDEKEGPYHKVIVKEVQSTGGNKVKSYYCMSCNIYVTNLKDFKLHPCKTLKYPCPHCPVAYENSKSLCGHMKVHKQTQKTKTEEVSTELPATYVCGVCNTVFLTNKSLKLHKRMHDPIKARPIEPPVEKSDGTETSTDKYKCEVCDKMIPNDYRAIHQNSHDSNELNCDICNRKFHSSEYLEMHMSVHNSDKVPVNKSYKSLPYSCLYCSRRFGRPHEKVKHERIHTGEKPHSCEICGKSFRVSYCLTLHMRTHTGARPYCCKHCGKRFKAHSVYNHHLLTHSEVRAYKCPYCPKAFKTSVQLAGHKNSHTKPFSCQHCNRPFASLYAVRVHTETHARQNNLKFSCATCGASYARAFALKDHVKQVHHQDIDTNDLTVPKDHVKQVHHQDIDTNDLTVVSTFTNLLSHFIGHWAKHARQNNLKFACATCGASYARAFALKDHVKQVHHQDIDTSDLTVGTVLKGKDEWSIKEDVVEGTAEVVETLDSKELTHEIEITDLEMTSGELIIP